jgi:PAS domain S-box-containing protein
MTLPSASTAPPISSAPFLARLAMGVLLINLFVCVVIGLALRQGYHQYRERAEISTRNLALVLESEINRNIETEDVVLSAVMDEYLHQRSAGIVDGKALNTYIERVRSRRPEIDALRITDAQGLLIYGSDVAPGSKVSLADRPHFIRLRDDPKAGLVISKPQISRINQKWVLVLARRMEQPEGVFAGMAFAAIALEQMAKTFSAINVGANGVRTLRDDGFVIIARSPDRQGPASMIGQKAVPGPMRELVQAARNEATFEAISTIDNIERTYSFRRVSDHPLLISVGLARDDYLAEWRRDAIKLATLMAFFALLTLAAARLIYLTWQRQRNALITVSQREEALSRSEARFRHLFEKNSSVMLLIEPSSGSIVDANTAAVAYYGYPRERLIGMCINEINTQPPELIAEERQQALREERNYFLFPHRLASGEVRDVEVHTTPIETDGRPLLLSIVHDITERTQLEVTLKESEQRYRTVADFTSDWEYWAWPDGRLNYVSPSCEQICGYSPDEFYGDPQLLTRIIHPEDQSLYAGHTHNVSAKGAPEPIDYRIRTKDGETRWISHVCRTVHDPDGQALGQRASNRDITERKHAEEELRRFSAELEQKTRAITRTNADLQRFAEVTAHHLQEPVRRMATYAERLTQQLSDRLDDEEALLSLEFIGQQARREQNLLRDVERYLAADRPRGQVKALDAGKAVTEILGRMALRLSNAGAEITLGNLPPALLDAPRLDDAFVVTLENALGHGRGEQPLRITIEGQRLGNQVRYSISDNGPGMKEEYREQVFGIFERLSSGDTGTGVGLAILRRVAESCDGRAWIEEAPGGGCRVLFELPVGELP